MSRIIPTTFSYTSKACCDLCRLSKTPNLIFVIQSPNLNFCYLKLNSIQHYLCSFMYYLFVSGVSTAQITYLVESTAANQLPRLQFFIYRIDGSISSQVLRQSFKSTNVAVSVAFILNTVCSFQTTQIMAVQSHPPLRDVQVSKANTLKMSSYNILVTVFAKQ